MIKPLIFIFSLCFLLAGASSVTEAQVKAMNTRVSAADENDRVQDGLKGPVRRVRLEMAQVLVKDGKQVEGGRQLRGIATYDPKGRKIDSVAYPVEGDSLTGKEQYRYDEQGNIIEMIVRDVDGSILSKETYKYEFDSLGNWNKMTTSVALYENGVVSNEPIEVSYRTIAYYYGAMEKLESGSKPSENATASRASGTSDSSKPTNKSADSSVSGNQTRNSVIKEPSPSVGNDLQNKRVAEPVAVSNVAKIETKLPNNSSGSTGTVSGNHGNEESVTRHVSEPSEKIVAATLPTASSDDRTETRKRDEISPTAALYQTGITYLAAGAYDQAVDSFNQLVRLNPNDAMAQAKLGLAFSGLHKHREAVAGLNLAIRLKPEVINAEEYYQLGYSYSQLGLHTEAASAFNKALYATRQEAIDNEEPSGHRIPAAQIYYNLGIAHYALKRYQDATKELSEAVKLNPQFAEAYYSLGLAYLGRGDQWSARKQQKSLLSLNTALAKKLADEISSSTLRESVPCASTGFCR